MLSINSKKAAIGLTVFISLTIILISTMVMLGVFKKSHDDTKQLSEGLACRTLLGLKKAGQSITGFNPIARDCQTINVEIPGNNDPANKFQLEYLFAEKIKKAWYIVHEGTIKDLWGKDFFGSLIGDKNQCVILYTINYKEKSRSLGLTASLEDFNNFLMTSTAFKEDGKAWTYLDYIQSYGKPSHLLLVPRDQTCKDEDCTLNTESLETFLSPGHTYGIAISANEKGKSISTKTLKTASGAALIIGGLSTFELGGFVLVAVGINQLRGETKTSSEVQDDENNFVMFGDLSTLENMGCRIITPS